MNPTDPDLRPGHAPLPEDGAVVTAGPLTPPPDSAGTPADDRAFHHSVAEDVQGMVLATLVASLGLAVFAQGGLMIGGWAGVATGVIVFAVSLAAADRWLHLRHLMADWVFARDLESLAARQARLEARFDIRTEARTADVESVLGLGKNLDLALLLTAAVAAIGRAAALPGAMETCTAPLTWPRRMPFWTSA